MADITSSATSTGTLWPYVPEGFWCTVFDALHRLSHPGIWVTQKFLTTHYVWPRMSANWQDLAYSASIPRHRGTPWHHLFHSLLQMLILTGFIRISCVLYHPLGVYRICWHVSTVSLVGLSYSWSPTSLQKQSLRVHLYSMIWSSLQYNHRSGSLVWVSTVGTPDVVVGNQAYSHHSIPSIYNGLVERFHCQLNATMRCIPTPTKWVTFIALLQK